MYNFYSVVPLITEHMISMATTLRKGMYRKRLSVSEVLNVVRL